MVLIFRKPLKGDLEEGLEGRTILSHNVLEHFGFHVLRSFCLQKSAILVLTI